MQQLSTCNINFQFSQQPLTAFESSFNLQTNATCILSGSQALRPWNAWTWICISCTGHLTDGLVSDSYQIQTGVCSSQRLQVCRLCQWSNQGLGLGLRLASCNMLTRKIIWVCSTTACSSIRPPLRQTALSLCRGWCAPGQWQVQARMLGSTITVVSLKSQQTRMLFSGRDSEMTWFKYVFN